VIEPIEPVEAPGLVRAAGLAESRPDAAVGDRLVEAVGAVHRRADSSHVLARRVLAVLAGHPLMDPSIVFPIRFDWAPVHLPAVEHALLGDDEEVVLGLARDRASAAADAGGQIDRHRPLLAADVALREERWQRLLERLGEAGVGAVLDGGARRRDR